MAIAKKMRRSSETLRSSVRRIAVKASELRIWRASEENTSSKPCATKIVKGARGTQAAYKLVAERVMPAFELAAPLH